MVTDADGAVVSRQDYYPFGATVEPGVNDRYSFDSAYGVTSTARQRFTGKERDEESTLDYFGARYYSASMGRFTTPDAPFADQEATDPQSWNLYSYTRNRPTTSVDVGGRFVATVLGATLGAAVNASIAAYRGEDIGAAAASGALSGALAGAVIDTGGAALGFYGAAAASGAVGAASGGALDRFASGGSSTLGQVGRDAAVGAVLGVGIGAAGKAVANSGLATRAANALDDFVGVGGAGKRAAASAVVDVESGRFTAAASGPIPGSVNPQLAAAAERAGGVGAKVSGAAHCVGNCAEFRAANQLLNAGSKLNNLRVVKTVVPRTGEPKPMCAACEVMFREHQN